MYNKNKTEATWYKRGTDKYEQRDAEAGQVLRMGAEKSPTGRGLESPVVAENRGVFPYE